MATQTDTACLLVWQGTPQYVNWIWRQHKWTDYHMENRARLERHRHRPELYYSRRASSSPASPPQTESPS